MQKKFYVVCVVAIIIIAVLATLVLHRVNHDIPTEPAPETAGSVVKGTVSVEDGVPVEIETETSEVKDMDAMTEEFRDSIQYQDINITVTTDGFSVSDAFKWGDDDYWYEKDPEGFARYSAFYEVNYGDYFFKAKASDSLNEWIGEHTSITYALAAVVGEVETDDEVSWYVIFREYPDDLVQATYNKESDSFAYEKLF